MLDGNFALWRSHLSFSEGSLDSTFKKKEMVEYKLLEDIVAKSLLAKVRASTQLLLKSS